MHDDALVIPDVCDDDYPWSAVTFSTPANVGCTGCGRRSAASIPVVTTLPLTASNPLELQHVIDEVEFRYMERKQGERER